MSRIFLALSCSLLMLGASTGTANADDKKPLTAAEKAKLNKKIRETNMDVYKNRTRAGNKKYKEMMDFIKAREQQSGGNGVADDLPKTQKSR